MAGEPSVNIHNFPAIIMIRWMPGERAGRLADGELRVFRSYLTATPAELEEFARVLSNEEIQRANRFVFSGDRDRFIKGRAVLRQILAGLLDEPARDIQLNTGQFGKPCFSPSHWASDLRFNLSHSHGLALYAFSWHREVGIDLEKVLPDHVAIRDVTQYFSAAEAERIENAPESEQSELFYRCWVMKEAFVKACGAGLQIPLNEFTLPEEWADLEEERATFADNWSILPFVPHENYSAAAVVESRSIQTTFWDLLSNER